MNIQIFGTSKCFDTKKAQRYFKERGIKFQMIDLKEKGMSRGEFDNVARALGGWEALVNPAAKDKQTLALLDALVDWQKEDKLFENQQLFKTPIVRNRLQPVCAITSRYPAGMGDADSIYNSFLSVGISFHALIQPADTCLPVQYLVHLLYLVVPVRTPFLQRVYQPLFPAVRTDGHIVKG